MIILGIDPGKSGGLALLAAEGSPRLLACSDVPGAPDGSDDLLDVDAIIAWVQQFGPPDAAFIERVTPMPSVDQEDGKGRRGMGATSAFNFGGAVYTIRTCVVGLGIKLQRVETTAWKKAHGLSSRHAATGAKLAQRDVKEQSRQRAIKMFGERFFPNKGHHNRAEAALIANYGHMLLGK